MTQLNINRTIDTTTADSKDKGIYVLGAAAALTAILLVLLDMVISMAGGVSAPTH